MRKQESLTNSDPRPTLPTCTPAYLWDTHNSSTGFSLCLDPGLLVLSPLAFPGDACLEQTPGQPRGLVGCMWLKETGSLLPGADTEQMIHQPFSKQSSLPLRLHSEIRAKAKPGLLALQGSIVKSYSLSVTDREKAAKPRSLGQCWGREIGF